MLSPSRLTSGLERYFRLLSLVAAAALVVMMLITVADVFMRYVFNAPIRGSYDLVEICLLVSVFFALPIVILEGQAILIDLIDGLIASRTVRMLKIVAAFTSAAVLVFLFWSMLRPTREAFAYGDVKLELGFPIWVIWGLALFGLANSIAASLVTLKVADDDTGLPLPVEHAE